MKYEVEKVNSKYEIGKYFIDKIDRVYRIIVIQETEEVALLNVTTGEIESEFFDTVKDLVKYTYLGEMVPVEQVEPVKFKVII